MDCVVNSQALKANSSTRPITREKIIISVDNIVEQQEDQMVSVSKQFVLYNRLANVR